VPHFTPKFAKFSLHSKSHFCSNEKAFSRETKIFSSHNSYFFSFNILLGGGLTEILQFTSYMASILAKKKIQNTGTRAHAI
jgi:hypothetical protein